MGQVTVHDASEKSEDSLAEKSLFAKGEQEARKYAKNIEPKKAKYRILLLVTISPFAAIPKHVAKVYIPLIAHATNTRGNRVYFLNGRNPKDNRHEKERIFCLTNAQQSPYLKGLQTTNNTGDALAIWIKNQKALLKA